MEGLVQIALTYGPWLILGGGLVLLARRTRGGAMGGCCGAPQQAGSGQMHGRGAGASCQASETPVQIEGTSSAPRSMTVMELQAQLGALRTHQAALAQQLEALEVDPSAPRMARPEPAAGVRER